MTLFQNVFEENDRSVSRTHRNLISVFVEKGNHAVRNVNEILRPGLAHKLENLENLTEMKILLICDYVKALVEIVMRFAVASGGKVSRRV